MSSTTPGLPRNYLAAGILLLLNDGPAHGYDLLERLEEIGLPGIDTGRLYRRLRRLESENLVSSWWDASESGPARRMYSLTEAGVSALHDCASALEANQVAVSAFLARYRTSKL